MGRSYSAAELAPHDRYTITTRAKIKNFFAQLIRAINTRQRGTFRFYSEHFQNVLQYRHDDFNHFTDSYI